MIRLLFCTRTDTLCPDLLAKELQNWKKALFNIGEDDAILVKEWLARFLTCFTRN
jgi:hypothetical protein